MRRRAFIFGAVSVFALVGCSGGSAPRSTSTPGPTVLAVARANGFTRFVRAAEAAGFAEMLALPGPFTLFVPTDRAFGASSVSNLGPDDLRTLIAYHIVPGLITTDFTSGVEVNHTTLQGASVTIDGTADLTVNGAVVSQADLIASNGVIFAINRVLTPR